MMLGSNSREDKCRRCRGNGTDCYTTKGILDSQDYRKGTYLIFCKQQGRQREPSVKALRSVRHFPPLS